jgi:eukaryotic-like serine/threonine-protein kinase
VTDQGTGSGDAPLIADRYVLGEVIGRGGMAIIHRATDTRTGRAVAIKLLRPEIGADRELADRFRREALATTVLRHPNIVACLDTGTDPAGAFLVMELIEGEDLAARLRRDGALPPVEVARIGLDLARGLGAAHVRGIVHRDVKPGNILLARDGRAMITDFGIARLAADAEAAMPGTTLGSVQYFSPEQAQGQATSAATDVYGLGLVMFEALTARRPWHGATTAELALARVGASAPSPRELRASVPAALDAIVVRALAPAPDERYPNGGALAAALEAVAGAVDRTGTTRVSTPGADRAGAAASRAASPARVDPARPAPGRIVPARATLTAQRRPRRSDGGLRRSIAVFAILGLALAGTVMAFSPRDSDGGSIADLTAEPTAEPTPTPKPKPTAKPTAKPTPTPTPTAEPTPTPPPAELCEPFLNLACGVVAGRYTPTVFSLPLAFRVGDGWSVGRHDANIVTLTRAEGSLTFATGVGLADPSQGDGGDGSAADLVTAFVATDGSTATDPANVRIDAWRGRSTDVTPKPGERPAIFVVGETIFYLEPDRTTRLVALDVDGSVLVLVIEPAAGNSLRDLLDTADDVAASLRFG